MKKSITLKEIKQWREWFEEGSKKDYENKLIFDKTNTKWTLEEVYEKLKEDNII
tara:strand:+ start:3019 stop:3180 length:162 start_codon:yes stop_codon:yes gene_type:complete